MRKRTIWVRTLVLGTVCVHVCAKASLQRSAVHVVRVRLCACGSYVGAENMHVVCATTVTYVCIRTIVVLHFRVHAKVNEGVGVDCTSVRAYVLGMYAFTCGCVAAVTDMFDYVHGYVCACKSCFDCMCMGNRKP